MTAIQMFHSVLKLLSIFAVFVFVGNLAAQSSVPNPEPSPSPQQINACARQCNQNYAGARDNCDQHLDDSSAYATCIEMALGIYRNCIRCCRQSGSPSNMCYTENIDAGSIGLTE